MASKKDGILYTGVTNNLARRVSEHKQGLVDGFTKKYFVHKLVYYETTSSIEAAIIKEKQIKNRKRQRKIDTINAFNPEWKDLSENI